MRTHALVGGLSPAGRRRAAPARPEPSAQGTPWSFGLLQLFLLLLFLNLPMLVPALEPLAPAQTLAVAALLVLFIERAGARQPIRLAWPESHLLLAFLGVAVVSSFTALWPRHALENTWLLAKFVAVYVLMVNTVASWQRLRWTFGVLAIGAVVPAVGALQGLTTGLTVHGRAAWLGIYGNPNDLAYTMVMLVPLGLALATAVRGWRRLVLLLAVAVCLVAAFLTYSRGGLLALGLVLLLCLWRWMSPLLRLPALVLIAATAVFVLPDYWQRQEGLGELQRDYTIHQRLGTIQAGLAMLSDKPLLGVGPGCSLIGFPEYAPADLLSGGWLHTHNTFIQVLSEMGLLGATIYALLLGIALLKARRLARRLRAGGRPDLHRLVTALEISIWGFLACSMGGGYVLSWFPYLVVGLVSAASLLPVPAPVRAARRVTLLERSAQPCAASPAF